IVREPRATISGEQAYKFRHVLIREVAYSGLSKMSRAELHRAFAGWLKERAGDELVEIRAFHLDQAARLLAELDGSAPPDLNEEAASALTHAGRRAAGHSLRGFSRRNRRRRLAERRRVLRALGEARARGGTRGGAQGPGGRDHDRARAVVHPATRAGRGRAARRAGHRARGGE